MIVVETIVRVLAILGAFALGGWGTGLILGRVSDRYYKKHKLPGWASWLARTCGGSLAAFVTY
ncbi:MAG: hypothetical protein EBV06_16190, partial [Planctomycetia bacterium]|nr:hypothetical protein [Planctomycetia bacterium]